VSDPFLAPNAEPPAEEIELRAAEAGVDYEVQLESLNQWQLAWRKFRKHRLAIVGLVILIVLVVAAIVGPILSPFVFNQIPKPDKAVYAGRPPSLSHPFGETGGLQRDVLQLVVDFNLDNVNDDPDNDHLDDTADDRLTTCGVPIPGFELRVVDPETGSELPYGRRGELIGNLHAQGRGAHHDHARAQRAPPAQSAHQAAHQAA